MSNFLPAFLWGQGPQEAQADEEAVDYAEAQSQEAQQAQGEAGTSSQASREVQSLNPFGEEEALMPVWGPQQGAAASGAGEDGIGKAPEGRSAKRTRDQTSALDRETTEERQERIALEEKNNFAAEALSDVDLKTIGEAKEYCQALIAKQLERADQARPPINEGIYGDSIARRAVTTLLPDSVIRDVFLETTRTMSAWPRLRCLFGAPPFNFLRPEDAGIVRASGIASGRKNMTYEEANQTAAYAQFGSAHLLDEYSREYRVLPSTPTPSMSDPLPYDINRVEDQTNVVMNIRVPKRSREEKTNLLRDQQKKRAVVFPFPGEVLKLVLSTQLQGVWGAGESGMGMNVRVTRVVPRSSNASTAAVLAVRVK